ncbi:2590_t:CDS:2, partial [Funneliformis mosseae]
LRLPLSRCKPENKSSSRETTFCENWATMNTIHESLKANARGTYNCERFFLVLDDDANARTMKKIW